MYHSAIYHFNNLQDKRMTKNISVFSVALFAFFALAVTPAQATDETIVDIAVGNDDFSTLVEFVVAEDLVDTLASEGPFTVFAPTNDAFAALPAFAATVLEENPELVSEVLLYHVLAGEFMAADVLAADTLTTVQGDELVVNMLDEQPRVDSANIVATDIEASNGVIHVIDSVLLPESVYVVVLTQIRDALAGILAQLQAGQQYSNHY